MEGPSLDTIETSRTGLVLRLAMGAIAGLSLVAMAMLAVVMVLGAIFGFDPPAGFTIAGTWLFLSAGLLLSAGTGATAAVAAMSGSWPATLTGIALFMVMMLSVTFICKQGIGAY